jgi:hypothetical protein
MALEFDKVINNLKCPYQNFDKNLDICRMCQNYTICIDDSKITYIPTNPGHFGIKKWFDNMLNEKSLEGLSKT